MRKIRLVLFMLMLVSLVMATEPGASSFTYNYEGNWETHNNQVSLSWDYLVPDTHSVVEIEINRNGLVSPVILQYSQWNNYYSDIDVTIGDEYDYTLRFLLNSNDTGIDEYSDYSYLTVDTSEIEPYLTAPSNIQVGSGVNWEGDKTVLLQWDYTIPEGYEANEFYIQRADQDWAQSVYGGEAPYTYEDQDVVIGETYSYVIYVMLMNHVNGGSFYTDESVTTVVDTNLLPLSNIGTEGYLPGSYTDIDPVILTSADDGATIYYTLDGSEPTEASVEYTAPIVVPWGTTTTIKARAFKTGETPSMILSLEYTLTGGLHSVSPTDGSTGINRFYPFLQWSKNPTAVGYYLSIGSTTGGVDILDNLYISADTPGLYTGSVNKYKPEVSLLSNSAYYWTISSKQQDTDIVVANSEHSFTTLEDVTISSFPYNEGFETTTSHFIPEGWIDIDLNSTSSWVVSTINPAVGYNSMSLYMWSQNDWLFTPALELTAGKEYSISFALTNSNNAPVDLFICSTTGVDAVDHSDIVQQLGTFNSNYYWVGANTSFISNEDQTLYLAFKVDGYDTSTFYFDQLEITEATAPLSLPLVDFDDEELHDNPFTFELSHLQDGAQIYYYVAAENEAPYSVEADFATDRQLYSGPVEVVTEGHNMLFIQAEHASWAPSEIEGVDLLIKETLAAPTFSINPGNYINPFDLLLFTENIDADIYYTLDGSNPIDSPTRVLYIVDTAIRIEEFDVTTVKAYCEQEGYTDSPIITGTFSVTPKLGEVTFAPEGGMFTSAQNITLTHTDNSAIIYYTLDQSEPTELSTQYLSPINLLEHTITTIKAIAYKVGYEESDIAEENYTITGQVETPVSSPVSGIYGSPQTVSLSTPTEGATIWFTTDGSVPTTESTMWNGNAVQVAEFSTTTVKAIAVKESWLTSEVMTSVVEVTGQVADVEFSHDSGSYTGSLEITLSTPLFPTASIYYTTNDTDPDATSLVYNGSITLNSPTDVTIKAIAILANHLDSEITLRSYEVRNMASEPEFNVASGIFTSEVELKLTSSTANSEIYYSLDGSDPVNGILYAGVFTLPLDSTTQVRAITIKDGWYNSIESSIDVQVTGTVPTPEIDVASGIYNEATTVTVTNSMGLALIYYTLDGTTPTTGSTLYEGAITFNPGDNVIFTVKAFRADWLDSETATRTYTLPDETQLTATSVVEYGIIPPANPEINYSIVTNQTAVNITARIIIFDVNDVEQLRDSVENTIFSGITNNFTREVDISAANLPGGEYTYRVEVLNLGGDILSTIVPTSSFVIGVPAYTITGNLNHDFGMVAAGSENSFSFTINSTGTLALKYTTERPATPFTTSWIPGSIGSGDSFEITVNFNPVSYGEFSDELVLTTEVGVITATFTGEAVMGIYRDDITSIVTSVDFGTTEVVAFNIYNDSPATDLEVTLAESSDWVTLNSAGTTLSPDASLEVEVTLGTLTLDGGIYTTNLVVTSDDLNAEETIIPITLTVNGATISVSDEAIEVITGAGVDTSFDLTILNGGAQPLNYNLADGADWLVAGTATATIPATDETTNALAFDGDIAVGTYTTNITIQSNDVNNPNLVIPVTFIVQDALFGYTPLNGSLNYGGVAIGSDKSLEVMLKNTGNLPLTVNSITSNHAVYTTDPVVADLVLEGGTQQLVNVIFTPVATAFYNGFELEITYDDVNSAVLDLYGTGENPSPSFTIDWTDNSHDFGNVQAGSNETTEIRLYNNGNVELHFNEFVYENSAVTDFEFDDFTIDVGKDYSFDVTFSPVDSGIYELDVTINTDELASEVATIQAVVFDNSNTAELTYPTEDPYDSTDGVAPLNAIEGTNFEFKVTYTDSDNEAPLAGFPMFYLDLNHDGDTADFSEVAVQMLEVDDSDVTYSDGKEYNYFVVVPYGYNAYYRFAAYDSGLKEADGEATNWKQGPFVADQALDLGLYASHIEFDNYHPNAGEAVQVVAHIQNWGDIPVDNVPVTFLLDEVQFDQIIINHIDGNSAIEIETSVTPLVDGFLPVKVHVNRNNGNPAIVENNTLNNFASRPLVVGDVVVPGSIDVTAAASPSTAYENSYQIFTVYGRADYVDVHDPNLDVSGSFVRATLRETGEVVTTHTNSWGDYSVSFATPNAVGLYHIDVYVTDYTLEGEETATLDIIPRPDRNDIRIVVSTNYHETPRINPPTADVFDIYVTVSNTGTVDINNDIDVDLNENQPGMGGPLLNNWVIAGGLNAGTSQSYTYVHQGVPNVGWYYFHGTATHAAMALEDYTNNNTYSTRKYIYPALPDLTPTDIAWSNLPARRNHGVVGRDFNASVRVQNKYVTASGPTTATIDYRGPFTGNVWAHYNDIVVPALGTFEIRYLDFDQAINIPVGNAGFYDFRVTVDPINPGIIVEEDEDNNVYTETIEVKNPDWDFDVNSGSIEISSYNPNFGVSEVNFTADIQNRGTDSATDVGVKFEYARFQDGDVIGPWIQIGNIINIPFIDSNETVQNVTSNLWTVPDSDGYILQVTVDPLDVFAEYNENNNDENRWLGYEIYPWAHSNYYSTNVNTEAAVGRYISSRASWQADDVDVVFYDWFPHEPFAVGVVPVELNLQTVNIPGNNGTTIARASKLWTQVGLHKITCHADITGAEILASAINPNPASPDHFIGDYDNEIYEDNNVDYLFMTVYEPQPDLVAWSEFINPELLNPDEGEEITIQSSFENQGAGDVDDPFKVKFFIDSVQLGADIAVASINSNNNDAVQATELFSSNVAGAHVIRVELDTDDEIAETREDNNLASRVVVVGPAPNMIFTFIPDRNSRNLRDGDGISLSDSSPEVGDEITITVSIKNDGRAVGSAWLNLYYVIASDSTLIATREFTANDSEYEEIEVDWVATSEFGSITAVITDASPIEYNTLDNSTSIEFGPSLQFVSTYNSTHIDEDAGSQMIGDLDGIVENRDATDVMFVAETNVENVTTTIDQNNVLWVTPPADFYGTVVVTLEAINIYDDSKTLTFDVLVDNINDLPQITLPATFTTVADDTLTVDFAPFLIDVDDAEVSLNIAVEDNSNVSVSIRGIDVDIIPNPGYEGVETLYFSVTDDHSEVAATDSVVVTIGDDNETIEDAETLDITTVETAKYLTTDDVDFYTFEGTSDLSLFSVELTDENSLRTRIFFSTIEDGSDINLSIPLYSSEDGELIEVETNQTGYWFVRIDRVVEARSSNNNSYTINIKTLVSPKNISFTDDDSGVKLDWNEVSAAGSYKVYRKETLNDGWGDPIAIVPTNTFTDDDVENNYVNANREKAIYYYLIIASTDIVEVPVRYRFIKKQESDNSHISNRK